MELLKLLSASEIVAQLACFLLALAIFRVFLWRRFLKILDDRKDRIASEFKEIEAARSDVEVMRKGYESRLAAIDETGRARIQDAISEGRRIADEIRGDAQADAEKMVENAKGSIRMELAKAKEDLKDTMIDLTVRVAEHVVQEKLSDTDDRAIVERFLKEMDKK